MYDEIFIYWSFVVCVCCDVCKFVTLLLLTTRRENVENYRRETFIKFTRWQHPIMWHGARFAVLRSTYFVLKTHFS